MMMVILSLLKQWHDKGESGGLHWAQFTKQDLSV